MAEVELIEVPLDYYSYPLKDHLLKTIIVEHELVVELVKFHKDLLVSYHVLLPYYNQVTVLMDAEKHNKGSCSVAYWDKMMVSGDVNEIEVNYETFVVVVVVLMDHPLNLQI